MVIYRQRSPSDTEIVDPEEEVYEIETEVTVHPEKIISRRTAELVLSEDGEDYAAKLCNTLHLMSVYKSPPHIPGSLPSEALKEPEGGMTKFGTSQQNCLFCGGQLTRLEEKVRGRLLLAQGPEFFRVEVTPSICKSCEHTVWASDNCRSTQVLNYNNHLLVELRVLYDCREAFIQGTPITKFFRSFLAPLRSKRGWAERYPELAESVEQGTNVLNSLKNVYLAFEALAEHQFENQRWLWGRYPQVVTYDACMKLSTNFVTKNQLNASRSELNIDVDLMTVLLQLSTLSPIFFGGCPSSVRDGGRGNSG